MSIFGLHDTYNVIQLNKSSRSGSCFRLHKFLLLFLYFHNRFIDIFDAFFCKNLVFLVNFLIVVVVSIKQRLDFGLFYQQQTFLEFFIVLISERFADDFLTEIIFVRRNEGRWHFTRVKFGPIKPFQPRHAFHLIYPIVAQSLVALTLDQLIYELSCIPRPIFGEL